MSLLTSDYPSFLQLIKIGTRGVRESNAQHDIVALELSICTKAVVNNVEVFFQRLFIARADVWKKGQLSLMRSQQFVQHFHLQCTMY